ncbi:hypothetical protein AMATHDRAFT_451 [Amanita thiersii Skay4041]|uniref:Uncharacterized protein n=1 Tax=Amanita thiersii Skay4041 TaxID=703135 RepID=A0A2A9NZP7_9AGAR|nr:hypothetical protein AMATHDRAFT_451 [Amanita thiersii Skay4041]
MVRTNTRSLASHLRQRPTRVKSRVKFRQLFPPQGHSPTGYSPLKRPVSYPRSGLRNLTTSNDKFPRKSQKLRGSAFNHFYNNDHSYESDTNDEDVLELSSEQDSQDGIFHWEEEETLFSELMEGVDTKGDIDNNWVELLESLQDAFDAERVELKRDTAHAFVPTVNRIKKCYKAIDEQDRTYGEGILMLNAALKEHELMVVRADDEIKDIHATAQAKMEKLLKQIEEAYADREKLWIKLQDDLNKIVEPVVETLKTTPGKVEKTIAGLEKKSKASEKEEGNSSILTGQVLKELLSKF